MYFVNVFELYLYSDNRNILFIMKANKSKIFSQAWTLFRKYNITFGQALTKAWADFKRQFYVSVYNAISSKPQFAKKKLEAKKMYKSFEVSFQLVARNLVDNSNAATYYDGRTRNFD